ncbi:MAG TPA: hypothetical protein VNH18_23505 [Bryobacteraceae bacterium]|nr:2-oxoglutarate dehydrogenase E1 [Blastocatellia bacterium]HXJ42266.1 hypothetical protein [Bryobacteraceae bacterium]
MKALSLTQPWATLVAIGAKRIETRGWPTKYRGPLAIHAAKVFPGSAKLVCYAAMTLDALGWPRAQRHVIDQPLLGTRITQPWLNDIDARVKALPLGAVLCTCQLVNCLETEIVPRFVRPFTEQEKAFGNYEPGRFAFLLEDVEMFAEPIPAKGALGLWNWEPPARTTVSATAEPRVTKLQGKL